MTQKFSNEHEIQAHVKILKNFYEELSFYALICLGCAVIWLLDGLGYFWPIWPITIWGAPLLLKASRIGVISESIYEIFSRLRQVLPIFKPEWEAQKTEQLKYMHDLKDVKVPVLNVSKAETKAKKAAPKTAGKASKGPKKTTKKTVKKPASKKKK